MTLSEARQGAPGHRAHGEPRVERVEAIDHAIGHAQDLSVAEREYGTTAHIVGARGGVAKILAIAPSKTVSETSARLCPRGAIGRNAALNAAWQCPTHSLERQPF
jgi:hypothetical protein